MSSRQSSTDMRRRSRRSFVQVTKFISPAASERSAGKLLCGKVDDEISVDQGKRAARHVAIELLAVLKAAIGDLGCVRRIVNLFVMVNGAPHFTEPHRIADGASELLVQVLGERGVHSRSAISVAQLPFGACVEIDMIAEIEATQLTEADADSR
jgi:enamine deaminase RidA (YjgF/YER057c/UK114 family)